MPILAPENANHQTSSNATSLPLYDPSDRQTMFDQNYLDRLAKADAATVAHFHDYFGLILLKKIRSRLRSPEFLEDARQDTFLRVFDAVRKGGVRQPERFGSFVNSVCENVISEILRSVWRCPQVPENAAEPLDQTASAESQCLSAERRVIIRGQLAGLRKDDEQILRMYFLEERDKDEICQLMGIDREYFRVRMFRALDRLRNSIQKQTKTPPTPPKRNAAAG